MGRRAGLTVIDDFDCFEAVVLETDLNVLRLCVLRAVGREGGTIG
jgi:hypothetical protein